MFKKCLIASILWLTFKKCVCNNLKNCITPLWKAVETIELLRY